MNSIDAKACLRAASLALFPPRIALPIDVANSVAANVAGLQLYGVFLSTP
jgi:hypothetical protein